MNQKILDFFSRHPRFILKSREVAKHLKVQADGRKELRARLKRMALEGKILRHRGNRYSALSTTHTLTGILKLHYDGYGFLLPDDPKEADVFIPATRVGYALPRDRVVVSLIHVGDKSQKREGRVIEVLERGREYWSGKFECHGKQATVINREFSFDICIHIPFGKTNGAKQGRFVVVKMTKFPGFPTGGFPTGGMEGEIIQVLGESSDETSVITSILTRHNIVKEFPQAVLAEAALLPEKISREDFKRRTNLTHLPFITIDGLKARDFDDAVTVEKKKAGYILHVSIADVGHYVKRRSVIDAEAERRGTSVYLPDFAVPMLPEKLSNHLCSLKAGEDRLVLNCEILFDPRGHALQATCYEAVIRSQKRGIYEEIQNFFDGDQASQEDETQEVKKSLEAMRELAHLLMQQRMHRGSIDFDLPEAEVVYNHAGEIETITKAKRFFSHRLIEEFMISANVAVATLLCSQGIPVLYRVHDDPDPGKLEDFFKFVKNAGVSMPGGGIKRPVHFAHFLNQIKNHPLEGLIHHLLLRSMKLAIYRPTKPGHFGLNLKYYSHFTSPIRRYPDLTVHRQLKTLLEGMPHHRATFSFQSGSAVKKSSKGKLDKKFYTESQLERIGQITSRSEREAMEAEREVMDLKGVLLMKQHLGDKFYGTIRRLAKFGFFVELEPHFVTGLVPMQNLHDDYYEFDSQKMELRGKHHRKKGFHVGQKLWVKVRDISFEKRSVELELVL